MIAEVKIQKIEEYNETIMAIQNKVKGGEENITCTSPSQA